MKSCRGYSVSEGKVYMVLSVGKERLDGTAWVRRRKGYRGYSLSEGMQRSHREINRRSGCLPVSEHIRLVNSGRAFRQEYIGVSGQSN